MKANAKAKSCIIHPGYINKEGYGKTRSRCAHRVAWEKVNGKIPKGLVIDHICRVRSCINVKHLRVVTQRENVLAGNTVAANYAKRKKCNYGHPFSGSNVFFKIDGYRSCRKCLKERQIKYAKKRTA